MFEAYKEICKNKLLEPGKLWLWRGNDQWVLNFPTKIHWRNPSKIEWIEAGLEKFASAYLSQGIREVSFPRLGCGNGGLQWIDVKPLMERYLSNIPIDVYIHDYEKDIGLPEHMEFVAREFKKFSPKEITFDAFISSLQRILELADNRLIELGSDRPFFAELDANGDLKITWCERKWLFERDDLRGVWLSLMKGLLTKDKAGWSLREGGEPLISILSLLPEVRPVEIERFGNFKPEVALEFRPKINAASVPQMPNRQSDFAWH